MGKKIVHKQQSHGDYRHAGQTEHEYQFSTACGYVRNHVTSNDDLVTCKLCLREMRGK